MLEKNMLIGFGLGFSVCLVVVVLVVMNEFCGKLLNEMCMLVLMGEMEGCIFGSIYYDNVVLCYFGGMQLMIEENGIISQQVFGFDEWLWVLVYLGIKVFIVEVWVILLVQYCCQDCIVYGCYFVGFIYVCYICQLQLVVKLMKDVIVELY